MSAAEHADHAPPPLDVGGDAAVIDIRVGRQATRATKRAEGRRAVSTPHPGPGDGSGPDGRQSPQQMLAEHFEITFNHHSLSLTDEMTRTAFTVTLEIMRGMLKGAEAQGIVDEEQRGELDAMIKGMLAAPRLLSG
jgi:hypothetical protein